MVSIFLRVFNTNCMNKPCMFYTSAKCKSKTGWKYKVYKYKSSRGNKTKNATFSRNKEGYVQFLIVLKNGKCWWDIYLHMETLQLLNQIQASVVSWPNKF